MDHSILSTLDLVIIGVYLVAMVSIGLYFVRRIKGSEDYYVAGRSFGPLILMATVCATIIGGSGLMGRAGKAYSFGTMAITTALPYLIGMFIFSGISGRISRMGTRYDITSMPELFEKRFGKTAKIILACMVAFTMMGTVASQVTATATIIKMLGGNVGISYEAGAMIACVVFMLYTATSGLFGVVFTDVFQFYMLLLFVYILIPTSAVHYVGGWSNFTANLSPELTKPYINGSIVGDIVTYLVFTLAGAEMWQRAFAAKSDKSAKRGMFLGTTVYGLTILLVYLMGIIGHQILGDNVLETFGSTDAVVPALAVKVLPVGLTGLALAGLLSVIMSTADSYLLVSVQTCVHDIGKTINPKMPEKREPRNKILAQAGVYGGWRNSISRSGPNLDPQFEHAFRPYEHRWEYGLQGGAGFALMFDPVEIHFNALVRWSWSSLYDPDYYSEIYYRYAYPLDVIATVGVSLATYKSHPSVYLEA